MDPKNNPIYVPGQRDLDEKSLGLASTHSNGYSEYDMHNMYAFD